MRHLIIVILLLLPNVVNAQSIKGKHDCALSEFILKDTTIRKHFYIDKRIKPISFYNDDKYFIDCHIVKVNGKSYEIYSDYNRYHGQRHSPDSSYFCLNVKDMGENKLEVSLYKSSSQYYADIYLIKNGQKYNVVKVECGSGTED